VSINPDTTTVRRSVVVEAPIELAFSFFTRDIGAWWDSDKHLLGEPLARDDLRATCRRSHHRPWHQRGGEPLGTVLVYEPPDRVTFSWDINLSWQIETDPARASEVHITFTAQDAKHTVVELEHRHLDRHGNGWEAMRDAVGSPGGWDLQPYADALSEAA